MNIRERKKRERIENLKRIVEKDKDFNLEELTSAMIVNHGISRKTALEEINAVKIFMRSGK